MKDDLSTLESLGRRAADALGDGPDEKRREAQRRALIAAAASGPAARRRGLLVPVLAAAAAFLLILGGVAAWKMTVRKPAQFWVGETLVLSSESTRLKAPADGPLPVRFEDGSTLLLGEAAAGKVAEATTKSVRFVLDSGGLDAMIRKNTGRTWSVVAGPYTVTVTGTTFSVFWKQKQKLLRVTVTEGSVRVTGGEIAGGGLTLTGGERLHIDGSEGIFSIGPAKDDERTVAAAEPSAPSAPTEAQPPPQIGTPDEAPAAAVEKTGEEEKKIPTPPWKILAQEGKYEEAMEAAGKAGFEQILKTASQPDLWLLADTARYARDGKKAESALLAIRERFASSKRAKIAAFLLGRVALELNKDPSGSVGWFTTYLEEDPGGPLAEEALGRLINACMKAGREQEAKKHAQLYLEKYEDGAFADLAKKVLGL
jgi:transmembrane sensor